MPVGAGSIKRAAKTAGEAKKIGTELPEAAGKAAKEPEVIVTDGGEGSAAEITRDMTKTASAGKKSKNKASGGKSGKKSGKEVSGKKDIEKKANIQKLETKKKEKKAVEKSAAGKPDNRYEAYRIGQPLPVHLL